MFVGACGVAHSARRLIVSGIKASTPRPLGTLDAKPPTLINNAKSISGSTVGDKVTHILEGTVVPNSTRRLHTLGFTTFRRRYVAIGCFKPITHRPLAIHPYDYTDGCWLHQDRVQREVRRVQFDFHALCKRVIELSPKAERITCCDKKEGGFNRVFIFSLDNGERLVARIPFSIAGPSRYTVSSEVATIEYRKCVSSSREGPV